MDTRNRALLVVGLALVVPAIACLSPGLQLPGFPTPTRTAIFGQEVGTPAVAGTEENGTPGGAGTEAPVDPNGQCLKSASGKVDVGTPCIVGTYSAPYDITQRPNDHITIVTDSLLQADVSLWAVSPGKLQGNAHLSYSLKSVETDPQSNTCQVVTDVVAPFSWDVNLKGDYFAQPDGSVVFNVRADPVRGPGYEEAITDCPAVPSRQQDGISWAGLGGTLQQGVSDIRNDIPVPSDAVGKYYVEIKLRVVK